MSDVLDGFQQPFTLIEVVQEIVDYKPVDVENEVEIQAVVQVADPDKIKSDRVDFNKRYLQVHTTHELKILYIGIFKGKRYKVFSVNDYSDYGYFSAYFEETKKNA